MKIFNNRTVNGAGTISNQAGLFCDEPYADIKYTALVQDTTVWDPLFIRAVSVMLASKISTQIRGDDGVMARELNTKYDQEVLPDAMLKDSWERKLYRYDPMQNSNFLRSRYGSTNG